MKKFAVVLSGSGVFDGSEIHEATLSLLAIARHGATYEIFAPDIPQHHVINHITGEEMNESRNVLIESARIARGKIAPLEELNPEEFDAILLPGGFGAAKNLSSWAFKGPDSEINPQVTDVLKAFYGQQKPIGALCISPVLLAKVFGHVKLTIGDEPSTILAVESVGAEHVITSHGEVVIDQEHLIFTTPCYMLDANIVQIAEGAEKVVNAMLKAL